MNLNMIRPKHITEGLLPSITKHCETLIEQTQRNAETLQIKPIKPRQMFRFNSPIEIKGDRMIGLTSLEVYTSVSNRTEENNKFERYTDPFDKELSFTEKRQSSRTA